MLTESEMERTGETSREMPKYQCHKEVWALKIARVFDRPLADNEESDGSKLLGFYGNAFAPRRVSHEYVRKHNPQAGGYFVIYEGGYESWSPADVFESGYTLMGGAAGGTPPGA